MNKKYYIFVGNEKIEVDQKIYQNYWQITNRENYLTEKVSCSFFLI